MHYFSPERRRINDLPCFTWGQPIPEPGLRPLEAGGYEISLMLGIGVSHWHWCSVASDEALCAWLQAWLADPEEVVRSTWPEFTAAPRARAQAPRHQSGKPLLSLDDIS